MHKVMEGTFCSTYPVLPLKEETTRTTPNVHIAMKNVKNPEIRCASNRSSEGGIAIKGASNVQDPLSEL